MTNIQIVASEVITNNIMTKEEVEEMLSTKGWLPFMTYEEWKYNGYQVKKGSKAVIKTKLWKQVKRKNEEGEEEKTLLKKFILVNASLFSMDQVEKIENSVA